MERIARVIAAIAMAGDVGCTDVTPRQQGTMSGAAIGAGAGIAAISGGNAWTGVAIGGAGGAVAGNIRGGRVQ